VSNNWYYTKNGQRYGPVPDDRLRQMAATGELQPADMLWKEGMAQWVPAHAIQGLMAGAPGTKAMTPQPLPPTSAATTYRSGPVHQPAVDAPPVAASAGDMVKMHLRRAFTWDLQTVPVSSTEKAQLQAAGIVDDALQRFAVWRRSVLLVVIGPTLLTAILSTVSMFKNGFEGFTGLGILLSVIETAVRYILPVIALVAALAWSRPKWSSHLLFLGWLVAFLTPFLSALVPVDWMLKLSDSGKVHAVQQFFFSWLMGFIAYLMLMPTVLSLLPSVLRACLRMKALLPASAVPGWFLVAGAPFYLLLWLVALVSINQLAGNLFLMLGVLLWIGAPMLYVVRADVFVRPLTSAEECRSVSNVQLLVNTVIGLAVVLLVVYLMTKKVMGLHLIGLDAESTLSWRMQHAHDPDVDFEQLVEQTTSLLWLFDPHILQFVVDWVGRSLFMTVVFADLLMRMTLSVWRNEQRFHQSEAAAGYGKLMDDVGQFLGQAER
jgi:hypothetical protein